MQGIREQEQGAGIEIREQGAGNGRGARGLAWFLSERRSF